MVLSYFYYYFFFTTSDSLLIQTHQLSITTQLITVVNHILIQLDE